MALQVLSFLICLMLAAGLRGKAGGASGGEGAWKLARRSLRWGMVVVTVPLMGYFGIERYAQGVGIPSPFAAVMCTGATALLLMGSEVEITGNIVVDAIVLSVLLVGCCFTVINGAPELVSRVTSENVCMWLLACMVAALLVRASIWVSKGQ